MKVWFRYKIVCTDIDEELYCSFGEENGWTCKEKSADYVWVLDPIDGTKSFITGMISFFFLNYCVWLQNLTILLS